MPARPPPTITRLDRGSRWPAATRLDRHAHRSAAREAARGQPRLLPHRQRDPPLEHLAGLAARSARGCRGRCRSSPARTSRCARRAGRRAPARGRTTRGCASGLEADQSAAAPRAAAANRSLDAEPAQILGGQVDAPALAVLAHVAEDVRQLHGDAEVVGESGCRGALAIAERRRSPGTAARSSPRRAGSRRPARRSLVRRAAHVQLDAVDEALERVERQAEAAGARRARRAAPGRRSRRPPLERSASALALGASAASFVLLRRGCRRRCRRRGGRTRRRRSSPGVWARGRRRMP